MSKVGVKSLYLEATYCESCDWCKYDFDIDTDSMVQGWLQTTSGTIFFGMYSRIVLYALNKKIKKD